uniref:60S large subunit ribosomal protein uL22 n=1 Tax=Euglena gracilis TaxID=3039 RepID=A0A7L5NT26_EUGGR|nr:60S large subunit ribosomal protein uL22 [Euglena gracilis]6ZJ3_Li Chain Li, Ribosomal protein uL22 [Euglena gracilis]
MGKAKYSYTPKAEAKCAKARGTDLRVHFKNTRETVKTLHGMTVKKAFAYLRDVLARKRCIPFRRYGTGCGRTPQAKEFKHTRGRWPVKSVEYVQNLLKNAVANANTKGLDPNAMFISHIQANRAQQQRRRTYRAHGRINPYMSNPCHLEVVLVTKEEPVKPPEP